MSSEDFKHLLCLAGPVQLKNETLIRDVLLMLYRAFIIFITFREIYVYKLPYRLIALYTKSQKHYCLLDIFKTSIHAQQSSPKHQNRNFLMFIDTGRDTNLFLKT